MEFRTLKNARLHWSCIYRCIWQRESELATDAKWLARAPFIGCDRKYSVRALRLRLNRIHVGGLPRLWNWWLSLCAVGLPEGCECAKQVLDNAILDCHPFPGQDCHSYSWQKLPSRRYKYYRRWMRFLLMALKTQPIQQNYNGPGPFSAYQSVGVMGDERTYENVVALRAVNPVPTAWQRTGCHLPTSFAKVSNDIINKVKVLTRWCTILVQKPPATIEWGNTPARFCYSLNTIRFAKIIPCVILVPAALVSFASSEPSSNIQVNWR